MFSTRIIIAITRTQVPIDLISVSGILAFIEEVTISTNIKATIIKINQGTVDLTISIASGEKRKIIDTEKAINALIPFASPKGFLKLKTA